MAVDVSLVKQSLDLAFERNPNLVSVFYDVLFRRHGSIRWMFQRGLRNVQERMFEEALRAMIAHFEDATWLRVTLGELGSRHETFGVTDEMYDWVGEALLEALADAVGSDWTPALLANWTEAYAVVAAVMRAGRVQNQGATRAPRP